MAVQCTATHETPLMFVDGVNEGIYCATIPHAPLEWWREDMVYIAAHRTLPKVPSWMLMCGKTDITVAFVW